MTTNLENGEVLTMEIRRSESPSIFKSAFQNIVAWLERKIDKSEIAADLTITSADDYEFHGKAFLEDKRQVALVVTWLDPIINKLFRAHRASTAERNRLQAYASTRASIRERALSAWSLAETRRADEESRRLEEIQRDEEEARRQEESDTLREQGKHREAALTRARPITTTVVPVSKNIPTVKGIGGKKKFKATIQNEEQLLCAIARPIVLYEAAAALTGKYGKDAAKFAKFLKDLAKAAPGIPIEIVEFKETKVNTAANAPGGAKYVAEWPGVVVEEDFKTSGRTR